jgi:two-component system, response regulator PdtaR
MTAVPGCVLIVDDEFLIATTLVDMVTGMGLNVCGTADTADKAIALAIEHRPHLVLMDVRLKGSKDGIEAAHAIRDAVDCRIIFITASQEPATVARMQSDHVADILFKPIRFKPLREAITRALM